MEANILRGWCKKEFFWVLLIFICASGIRFYKHAHKETLLGDELLTLVLCTYADYGSSLVVETKDGPSTGKEIKTLIFSDDNGLKNIAMDIWNLRKSTRDGSHTNLYYTLLRITQFHADTSDFKDVMWRAFFLNMLFFSIGFFFFYKLAELLFNKKGVIIFIMGMAFLFPVSIANSLFMREYQLQEMSFIVVTYYIVLFCFRMNTKGAVLTWFNVLSFSLSIAILSLSGYFGILYIVLLGCFMLGRIIYLGNSKEHYLFIASIALLSLLFILIIYPSFFDALFSSRGTEVYGKFSAETLLQSLRFSYSSLLSEVRTYYINLSGILLFTLVTVIAYVWRKQRVEYNLSLYLVSGIVLSALLWVGTVFFLAPYKEMRYIGSAFPFLALYFGFLLNQYQGKTQKVLLLAGLLSVIGYSIIEKNVYWGGSNIDKHYKEHLDIPLVTIGVGYPDTQTSLTPLFGDDRLIHFTFNEYQLQLVNTDYLYDELMLICQAKEAYEILDRYEVSDTIFTPNEWDLYGYRMRRKAEIDSLTQHIHLHN